MSDFNAENTLDLFRKIDMGSQEAVEQLYTTVFDELHRRAKQLFRLQPSNHTLQATAVVNDAFIDVVGAENSQWENKRHFINAAAHAMRCIMVDHARARKSKKRGGGLESVTLSGVADLIKNKNIDVLALEEALTELEQTDARQARVVELRFFGGLTAKETGKVLGIAAKTAESDWYFARAWLRRALKNLES